MKILIVDDQAEVREIISEFLAMRGYSVDEAEDGRVALQRFKETKPDMAIVDVEMPVMNGLQFSRLVLESRPDFPIIMITAFIEKHTPQKLQSLGVKKILQKPLNLNDLHQAIQESRQRDSVHIS